LTAAPATYTLSLHDALPIFGLPSPARHSGWSSVHLLLALLVVVLQLPPQVVFQHLFPEPRVPDPAEYPGFRSGLESFIRLPHGVFSFQPPSSAGGRAEAPPPAPVYRCPSIRSIWRTNSLCPAQAIMSFMIACRRRLPVTFSISFKIWPTRLSKGWRSSALPWPDTARLRRV